jgi:hypothetical protein
MKNLFLVPTDKPSRLRYNISNQLVLIKESYRVNCGEEVNQQLYITYDKEIKKADWVFVEGQLSPQKAKGVLPNGDIECENGIDYVNRKTKKIILTTDPDLIADGVQSIDDNFLEWFVKNPSCEEVVVDKPISRGVPLLGYKIIIPQKESKQEGYICPHTKIQCDDECCVSAEDCHITSSLASGILNCDEPKQETLTYTEAAKKEERIFNSTMMSKQETLEEAAANLADPNLCKTDNWIAGANYQAERMYSEEEVKQIIDATLIEHSDFVLADIPEWFEQFKKK